MKDASSLEDMLDHMTMALQRGALSELGPLAAAIEAEMATMAPLDMRRAKELQRRAARNDLCLQAAARGVRAAIARIAGIGGAGAQLSTYGADGRKVLVGAPITYHSSRL